MSAPAAGSNFERFRTISAPFHPRGRCGLGQPRSGSKGLKDPQLIVICFFDAARFREPLLAAKKRPNGLLDDHYTG